MFTPSKAFSKNPKTGEKKGYATDRDADRMAVYPLAIPLMASPLGLVTLTIVSAKQGVEIEELILLSIMLLVIMAINLAALAMETILSGLGDALGEPLESAVKRLQEMGVLGQ